LDGWEATRQIKANPKTKPSGDCFNGRCDRREREKALAAGCDEYDTKPVDFTRLLGKIDLLLEPSEVPPAEPPNPPLDHRLQQIGWTRLRHDLEPPIYSIGYSDML